MQDHPPSALPDEVPTINFAPFLAADDTARLAVAREIRGAAESVGFMYLKGHGIPQHSIDAVFSAAHRFFALSEADKLSVKVNSSHRGYIPMSNSTLNGAARPSFNESYLAGLDLGPEDPDVKAGTPLHGPNRWPDKLPGFRQTVESYHRDLSVLGHQIHRAFAMALGLDASFFESSFTRPMPFVRLLHYPPQPPDRADDEFGIAPHTDYGFVTILAQDDVGGLQVRRRDGTWIDVPSIPGTFVVNIGDMLMQWTNDRWVSNPHRVINASGKERFSVPFFFDPTYHAQVECIPTCQGPDNPARYGRVTWGEYLKHKFDTAYAYRKEKQ